MFRNTHFALAVHALAVLAFKRGEAVTSAFLASSIGTNPAFLRKITGMLRDARLIEVTLGKGGGATLLKDPAELTLLDIKHAVTEEACMKTHACGPNAQCPVGRGILPTLSALEDELETAVDKLLASKTLQDISTELMRRAI